MPGKLIFVPLYKIDRVTGTTTLRTQFFLVDIQLFFLIESA